MAFTFCTIGCGSIATRAHGPAYARYAAEHPDTILAACCDLNAHRAETFRCRFGFQRSYTDIAAMLEAEKPDAVCLIAPVELTCTLACSILEKGFPLLMEKPPGQSVEEMDRMIQTAEAAGAPSQVAFNRRTMPLFVRLRRLLEEEVAPGAIQHVRLEFTRTGRDDPDFSTTAIHGIDTARFLVGSDYREIRFHYQPLAHFGEGVANVFLEALFQNGVTGHLHFCPMAGEIAERITVQADEQTFHLHLPI
jgi:myo-inositol 2-dehydrogenase/D-chiro-inositol 1-dehydrogenase